MEKICRIQLLKSLLYVIFMAANFNMKQHIPSLLQCIDAVARNNLDDSVLSLDQQRWFRAIVHNPLETLKFIEVINRRKK